MERAIVNYLDNYMVFDKEEDKWVRPKAKTLDHQRSNLKSALSELTGYNFGDKIQFPGLANATASLHKEIKQVGR